MTHGNGTSLTAGTGEVRAEGAAFKSPEWAKKILAVRVGAQYGGIVTDGEQLIVRGRVDTNDFNPTPFEFLCPPVGCADGTPATTNPVNLETYIMNAPINPGSAINTYFTQTEAATAAYPYAHVDYCFGSEGEVLPYDPLPGRQRYRKVGTLTAAASYAAGPAIGTPYSFNGGEAVTEIGGILGLTTPNVALSGRGYFEFRSPDVQAWPAQITANMYGAKLGATDAHLAPKVTRELCMVKCEPRVQVSDYFAQGEAQTDTTPRWVSMVEFIRPVRGAG